MSAANVNDITAAHAMPIEPGATYVFDLGYYDFPGGRGSIRPAAGIVTRFKTNTPLREARDLPLEPGSRRAADRIGFLPARQATTARIRCRRGARDRCDDRHWQAVAHSHQRSRRSAQEIADLYKRRWLIELFFRVMKQTLKITKFLGRSENAVRIQIAVALIAFLLLPPGCQDVAEAKYRPASSNSFRTRARQSDAPKRRFPPTPQQSRPANQLSPIATELGHNMNRTAVGLTRLSTHQKARQPSASSTAKVNKTKRSSGAISIIAKGTSFSA